jgi:hypothetical protein
LMPCKCRHPRLSRKGYSNMSFETTRILIERLFPSMEHWYLVEGVDDDQVSGSHLYAGAMVEAVEAFCRLLLSEQVELLRTWHTTNRALARVMSVALVAYDAGAADNYADDLDERDPDWFARLEADAIAEVEAQKRKEQAPSIIEQAETGTATLELTNGGYALIDAVEYDKAAAYTWRLDAEGYVRAWKGLSLARLIMDAEPWERVSYRNRNRRDCRRANLLLLDAGQLMQRAMRNPRSGYHGVRFDERMDAPYQYQAKLTYQGVTYLGEWRATAREAAADYNELALRYYGADAFLNNLERNPDEDQPRP